MKVYTEASVDVSEEKRIYSDANGVHTRGREDTAVSRKLTASLGDRGLFCALSFYLASRE
tara:strand:+ start:98 stop:277 length:180 start_codon:yes stop_codon:yes gene_type:complete